METTLYSFGGLRISSDIPLCGLQVCRGESAARCEVAIRYASIPHGMASATAVCVNGRYSGTYNGRELLVSTRVGRFLLRAGKEILVDVAPASNDDDVRAYLLGPVFGALCHQRGIAPLHASAIDMASGCVAFVGQSGAGKSTMAAALVRRGHQILGDDECFLQLGSNKDVKVWPGMSRIRLWEDATVALGFDGQALEPEIHGLNKYFIPMLQPRNPLQYRLLRGVFQLHRVPGGDTEVIRLHGADAIEVLMQNIYPPGLATYLGYQPRVFAVCVAVARDVPVFRLSRPWDFAGLNSGIELLENHLQNL